MTSSEFTEWQAFYTLEPFGDLIADQRHGVATSVLANINRNAETRPDAFRADDFIPWRETASTADPAPTLLDDPVAQSNLIRATMFGLAPREA